MRKKLHIFGCSFSELVDSRGYGDYIKWRNGLAVKTWSERLSEKLDLELHNYANGGLCNEIILQRFSNNIHNINKGDIVIFQWSFVERYSWVSDNNDIISTGLDGYSKSLTKDIAQKISVNRMSESRYHQILDYQKILDEFSKLKKFDIWYWYAPQEMYRYIDITDKKYLLVDEIMENNLPNYQRTTFEVVYDRGGSDIETETNGVVKDNHFSETSHQIKAELFYNHIKKYSKFV